MLLASFFSSLWKPTVFGLDEFWCVFGYLRAHCSLVPFGNHAHLRGGNGAKIMMNTLTYGWVEHWSDIASYREASSQDKYFLVFNLYNVFVYELFWTWWMCWMNDLFPLYISCIMHLYMYFTSMHFIIMFMGLDFPF